MIWLNIERQSKISLVIQVYSQIKSQILDGKIETGQKLPSTRKLALELGISRNSVMEAYDQLLAEGYINSKHGSGTRVADGIYFKRPTKDEEIKEIFKVERDTGYELIDFRSGVPALDLFPKNDWGKILKEVCEKATDQSFMYSSPKGRIELRKAISQHLFRSRGITCFPEQIFITSGATQGASLISKLLFQAGASLNIEDPVNHGLFNAVSSGYKINPIPVDNDGIMTDFLKEADNISFTYVTPSHQFPLGGILNIKRRIDLINYSRNTESFIIEDDYDSEFRYEGHPISSLYELDTERVIYIGSFSKILAPSLRLGYIILPDSLILRFKHIKIYSDVHTETFGQLALAKFIEDGKLNKHITRMKKVYIKRQKILMEELNKNFEGKYIVSGNSTGMHMIVELQDIEITEKFLSDTLKYGVKLYPVEYHAIKKGSYTNKLIMGYGHLNEDDIKEGIARLKRYCIDMCW